MTIGVELQRRIEEMARELCLEMYQKSGGPPKDMRFSQLEDDAVEVADAIARAVMERLLADRVRQHPSGAAPCPECDTLCDPLKDDLIHELLTRRGGVGWAESGCYCKVCRRSFFPGER